MKENSNTAAKARRRPKDASEQAGRRKKAAERPEEASADLFLTEARPAKKRASGAKHGKRRAAAGSPALLALNLFFLAGILSLLAVGALQARQHDTFLEMKDAVERQTFYDGTSVEGIDVSGMTLAEAKAYWRDNVEPAYANRTVNVDNGDVLTARDMGYQSDFASALTAAWSAGRSGSLTKRYYAMANRVENPVAFTVNRAPYTEADVDAYVQSVAARVNTPARDASITAFDAVSFQYEIEPEADGARLDEDALKQSLLRALQAGGGSVSLQISALEPRLTAQEIETEYGMIAYAVTNASSSSSARLANIELAMKMINGTCLKPGQTFSFNAVVGERTTERGFRMATAYSGGEVTEQVGGGICQVSTTLFNAAVKADLEVTERHNHSLTVGYVDRGKDATVNWGSQDLQFVNNTNDDVYICCMLSDDKRVRFGIFGRRLPNGERITVEADTVEVVKYDVEYKPTTALLTGQTYIAQKGRDGYNAVAYKIRWDAEGNEISRELLCRSSYKKVNAVVYYGL